MPADELLARCVEFLQRNGFSNLSLREIAAGVGTSHRMLIYHFGSRDGLLAAVVAQIEAVQRAALAALAETVTDPVDIGRSFWLRISDPSLAPAERLFFEIYAQAMYGRDWTDSFRAAVIDAWEGPLIELFASLGFDRRQAQARARLGLAATRGLLLDLLLTDARSTVEDAAELLGELLVRPLP